MPATSVAGVKLFAVVVGLFVVFDVLSAQPSTICTDPQTLFWTQRNCQGTPERQSFFGGIYCQNRCDSSPDGHGSMSYVCGLGHIAYSDYSLPQCQGPSFTTSIITQECINFRQGSLAVICRNGERVYPPKTQDGPVQGDGPLKPATECPAPYYCTPNVPYVTWYRDPHCTSSAIASYELHEGAQLGKCYLDQESHINVKMTCEDRLLTSRAFASGCHNMEYARLQTTSNECFVDSSGYGYRYFCGSTSFDAEELHNTTSSRPTRDERAIFQASHLNLASASRKYLQFP